jgi:NADH-quinone oxidoreductase subunit L
MPFALILIFPLAGFLVNGLLGRRLGERGAALAGCAAVAASFALVLVSAWTMGNLPAGQRGVEIHVYSWMESGDFSASFGFLLDPLSQVMLLVVTGVGLLIHIYSAGYMHGDPGFGRYFSYLNLFIFFMLLLVMADNLVLMFVGWEGVGLCSYLLIGFWFKEKEPPAAGMKAFIVNRIGDMGFALGAWLLFTAFGTVSFTELNALAAAAPAEFALWGGTWSMTWVLTAAALLLFVGAAGKSAQIPLYVWLPDAMAGPTPVSALIHAATMVTAGVYMVARMHGLYDAAPLAAHTVAFVGALTAFYAASMALVQHDIKKVLAYSTISQLGYMFLACGVGAYAAGVFHLMTHAFFKALLFLGAGSVIHALSGEQDIFKMGGLRAALPRTHWTFLIGVLAIAGLPPLAGFMSKDAILAETWAAGLPLLWGMAVATAMLTAFYMGRLYLLVFAGESCVEPSRKAHLHESPASMTLPLAVLALLSAAGGWVGVPHLFGGGNHFARWLAGWEGRAEALLSHETEWLLLGAGLAAAFGGMTLAWRFYAAAPQTPARLAGRFPGIYGLLCQKYYVDEIYETAFVAPLVKFSQKLWHSFDTRVVDGAVVGLGRATEWTGYGLSFFQSGSVRHYLLGIAAGAAFLLLCFTGVSPMLRWFGGNMAAFFLRLMGGG